jgi:pimeloyl-ACP methyl ester carboxylesterase
MAEPATIASVQADYVDVDGARIHVHRWGDGGRANIVYWHGGGGGRAELPLIAPALEKAGYSVFAPDAPGYGESPPLEDAGYRASNVARLATALIDTLGIAPTVWIGYSWGKSIGVHTAATAALPSAEVVPVASGHGILTDAGGDVRRIVLDWLRRRA